MTTQLDKGDGDGLDLAQLMDQIRKDAENRKRNSFNNGAPSSYRQLITQNFDALLSPHKTALPPLKLQPDLEKREQYQLNDLLGFHDEVFLRNAYKVILKREPDDVGLAHFLKNLRNGRYSKIDVLSSLRFSPEGERANVQIEGLGRLRVLRKLYRVPVAGYVLRLAVAIARLPVLITNFRRVESHTMAQLDRVAGHINEAVAHLSDEMRKQARTNRTQFEALQKQLNELKGTVAITDQFADTRARKTRAESQCTQANAEHGASRSLLAAWGNEPTASGSSGTSRSGVAGVEGTARKANR